MGWRLVFPLILDTGHDKHQYGYHIRRHGDELLYRGAEARYKDAADIETAEKEGAEDAKHRLPKGEDNDSDSQPAPVAEAVVGPGTAGVVHDPVEASQSCNNSSDNGGKVLVLGYVYTGGIGSGRVFAHSTHIKAGPGPVKVDAYDYGNNHRKVGQEAEVQPRNRGGLVPFSYGKKRNGAALAEEA